MMQAARLWEREAELSRLDRLVERANEGDGGMILLEGSAGIGKTSLLAAASEKAGSSSMEVLRARGTELERQFPLGVVRQLFSRPVENNPALLRSGAARLATSAFEGGDGSGGELSTTLHGLHWLAVNASGERPLLLVIDDLHWADRESLEFVSYLASRLDGLGIAIAGAVRTGPEQAKQELLARLAAQPQVEVLSPLALSQAAVAALVAEVYGYEPAAEFAAACHAASGGNPFLASELARGLKADGVDADDEGSSAVPEARPDAVVSWTGLRLAQLSARAQRVAVAVAILGPSATLPAIRKLTGIDGEAALSEAEGLIDAEVVFDEVPLRFCHPLMRTAVYEQLSSPRRAELHFDAARIIDRGKGSPEEVGSQLLHSTPQGSDWAAERLVLAGRDALARGAPSAGMTLLRRALEEPARGETRLEALREGGETLSLSGRGATIDFLRESHAAVSEQPQRAEIALQLAVALTLRAQLAEAIELVDEAIEELGPGHPGLTQSLEAQRSQAGRMNPFLHPEAAERLRAFCAGLEPGAPLHPRLKAALAVQRTMDGASAAEVAGLGEEALASGELSGPATHTAFGEALFTLIRTERYARAEEALDELEDEVTRLALGLGITLAQWLRADLLLRRGDVAAAEVAGRTAFETAAGGPGRVLTMSVAPALSRVLIERDMLEEAQETIEHAAGPGRIFNSFPHNTLLEGRARLRLARGDVDEGITELRELAERERIWRRDAPALMAWRSTLATALAARGEREEAEALAGAEVELAMRWGAPRATGVAQTALGIARGGREGTETLRGAIKTLEGSEAPLELARAQLALASALRRSGERREARPLLEGAIDTAVRCGALRLARQAQEELKATGARPRRLMVIGRDALTATERRVVTMAADGLSSREIAEALFVSVRTVDNHLGRAYRKLEIRGRGQLAKALNSPAAGTEGPA